MRLVLSIVIGLSCSSLPRFSRAEGHWVDDALVLRPKRVRLSAGLGGVYLGHRWGYQTGGTGLNLEEAVGIGHDMEVGARYAVRLDRGGRGTRADEFARASDTEKFGTGSGVVANPEFRLTWRVVRGRAVEVALENRDVLPIPTEPDATILFGIRLRTHARGLLRIDTGAYVAETWQKYYDDRALSTGLSAPVWVWLEPWRTMFVGMMGELRYTFATRYTESSSRLTLGAAMGYRIGASDLQLGLYFADMAVNPALRVGTGLFGASIPGVFINSERRIGFGLSYSIVL